MRRIASLARSVADLVRRGHFRLLVAHALRFLGLHSLLARLTCPVRVPGVPHAKIRIFVEPGDLISDDLCRYHQWEPRVTAALLSHLRPDGVFVDAGANLGYYSLLWIAAGGGDVHAFEPSPRIFAKFLRNLRLNGVEDRVHAHEVALSNECGSAAFDPGDAQQTGWGAIDRRALRGVSVTTTRLDVALAHVPFIDVLKIDTEGWDTRVLQGAERFLHEKRIGAIYFEQVRDRMARAGVAVGEAQAFLERCGYRVRQMDDGADPEENVTQWEALTA